jgi:hypothetical protein
MYNPATGQYECMAVYVGVYPYSYVGQLPYYNPPVYHFSVTVTGLTPCTLHGFHVERQPGGQGNWLTEQYYQCSTGQN